MKSAQAKSERTTMVRLSADGFRRLDEIADLVGKRGWSAIGVEREGLPTRAGIIEEALKLLSPGGTSHGGRKRSGGKQNG
jgi:hypothetical protein